MVFEGGVCFNGLIVRVLFSGKFYALIITTTSEVVVASDVVVVWSSVCVEEEKSFYLECFEVRGVSFVLVFVLIFSAEE